MSPDEHRTAEELAYADAEEAIASLGSCLMSPEARADFRVVTYARASAMYAKAAYHATKARGGDDGAT